MFVVAHSRIETHQIPGIVHRTVVGRQLGTNGFEVWDQTIAPGAGTPPHRHECEEAVVVLCGKGEVTLGERTAAFAAPCTLVLPPHVPHQIVNTGAEPVRLLGVFATSPAQALTPGGEPIPLPWKVRLAMVA
jgi:quercetin dioxygenase-like cupin family protein